MDTPTLEAPVVETPEVTAPVVETPAAEAPKYVITRIGDKIIDKIIEPPPIPEPAPVVEAPKDQIPTIPAPEAVPTPAPTVPGDEEEIDFFPYAAEQTEGFIKSPEDVFNLYKEHQELKKQLATKPEIEFPNPGLKAAYEYAKNFPGHEIAAVNGYYHVMSLGDVKKLSPKEAQFEAFALKYKNYPREEARGYFEAQYDKNFGEGILEVDKIAQFEHKLKTDEAIETLSKMQEEFSKPQPPSQPAGAAAPPIVSAEERAAIRETARKTLASFGGMSYQFIDKDADSVVNIPMEESNAQQLESWMSDPKSFLDDLTSMATDAKGTFSPAVLGEIMFEIQNRNRINQFTFEQGRKYGQLQIIRERKNTATPTPTPTAAAPPPKLSFEETMAKAVLDARGKK